MAKLSVVIITLNEEKNISRCLRSVEGLSDDVVVVDSGSDDLTESICNSFGVRFCQHEWMGYAETKNYANSLARNPLILSLDADEALSDELRESIQSVLKDQRSSVYSMNRLTNYCGKWIRHSGWYPDVKIRLFNNEAGYWSGSHVHETLTLKNGAPVEHLKGDLLHYSYSSIAEHIQQSNHFSDLAARKAFESGQKSSFFKVIFSPVIKFKRDYFLKGGFMDGYYGYIICRVSAFATFMKYAKLRQLNKEAKISGQINKSEHQNH